MEELPRADRLLRTGLKQQKISILTNVTNILITDDHARDNVHERLAFVLAGMKEVWKTNEEAHDVDIWIETLRAMTRLVSAAAAERSSHHGHPMHLVYPLTTTLDEEYQEHVCAYHREREHTVFLLTDDQVTKLVLPVMLDFVHDVQQKDIAEAAAQCIAAVIPRVGSSLKKTQVRAMTSEIFMAVCVSLAVCTHSCFHPSLRFS